MRRRAGGPRLPTARSRAVDLMLEELRVPLAATAGALIGLGCALLLIARSRSPEASATPRRRRLVAASRDSASSARLNVIGIFAGILTDRKSTRLNSRHVAISYAVFGLKIKTNNDPETSIIDI